MYIWAISRPICTKFGMQLDIVHTRVNGAQNPTFPIASLRRERIFVQSIPAAEKARSASTDVRRILTANKSTCTSCRIRPRTPLHLKTGISLFMAESIDLSFVQLRSGCGKRFRLTAQRITVKTIIRNFMILIVSDILPHINCFPFLHAFLRSVLTPEIKPVKPGFLPAQKPGFTGLKTGGLPGFSGTRLPLHSLSATAT